MGVSLNWHYSILFNFQIQNFLFKKINREHVVDHCVNVIRNFLKIYLKLNGIGNHFITKIGVVLIIKLFVGLMQMILGKLFLVNVNLET